eukprot:scaffold13.g318.t1
MDEDSIVPLSQLANEQFNSVLDQPEGPTDFAGLLNGAGPGPPSEEAAAAARQRKSKLFNDPIHGSYRLSAACTAVLDTSQFQRLRRLKQLGLTYMVFPGASHNRFEHSLGVAHLATKWWDHLTKLQRGEAEVERRDRQVVELAGLCHDLGHGPFSHVFEKEFLRQKGITGWEHEAMSAEMLQYLVDENGIDLPEDDLRRVRAMITAGHSTSAAPPGQRWLYEIVANGRNGIDVDKFDYLLRDSTFCGFKISGDPNRIIQFSHVIGDEICFKWSEYMSLYELFHSRASMHRQVYTHKKAKAIEFMVVDALLEADRVLRISDQIWSPATFQRLDDTLLDLLENFDLLGPRVQLEEDEERALRAAQAIIARIRRRDLYKAGAAAGPAACSCRDAARPARSYVTDALVPPEELARPDWEPPTAADIVACHRGGSANKIDHGQGQRNPLDSVHFFDSLEGSEKRKLRPDQISSMVVASFQEKSLRVYSRNSSPEVCAAVHAAFDAWVRQRFNGRVATATPCKPPRPPPPPAAATRAAVVAAAAGAAGGGDGVLLGKRSRGPPRGGSPPLPGDDECSPSNLMKSKHAKR